MSGSTMAVATSAAETADELHRRILAASGSQRLGIARELGRFEAETLMARAVAPFGALLNPEQIARALADYIQSRVAELEKVGFTADEMVAYRGGFAPQTVRSTDP